MKPQAARIHELRAEGYQIEHRDERHQGGKHRRYFLRTPRPAPTTGVQESIDGWAPGEIMEAYGR